MARTSEGHPAEEGRAIVDGADGDDSERLNPRETDPSGATDAEVRPDRLQDAGRSGADPAPADEEREAVPAVAADATWPVGSPSEEVRIEEPPAGYMGAAPPDSKPAVPSERAPAGSGWRRILRQGAVAAVAVFIPPLCLHCEGSRFADLPLCLGCLRKLAPMRGRACVRCGTADCADPHADWSHPFGAIHALFKVTPPLSTLVHGFKYRHQRRNITFLCAYLRYRPDLREAILAADALVPVPLHAVRRRERGFNQAEAIAVALGKACGRPVLAGALRRLRKTGTQTRLSREERMRNLGGAFACAEPDEIRSRRILLVDDVFTTGATAAGCAEALLKTGCASVSVLALGKVEKAEAADDFVAEMEAVASYLA